MGLGYFRAIQMGRNIRTHHGTYHKCRRRLQYWFIWYLMTHQLCNCFSFKLRITPKSTSFDSFGEARLKLGLALHIELVQHLTQYLYKEFGVACFAETMFGHLRECPNIVALPVPRYVKLFFWQSSPCLKQQVQIIKGDPYARHHKRPSHC